MQLPRRIEPEVTTFLARFNTAAVVDSFAGRILALAVFQATRVPANADVVRAYAGVRYVCLVFTSGNILKTRTLGSQWQHIIFTIMCSYRTKQQF